MKYIILLIIFINILEAHQSRENYLTVKYSEKKESVSIILEVETRLLENKTVDDNGNEIVSFNELRNHKKYLLNYVNNNFRIYKKGVLLNILDSNVIFHRYQDQTYMQIKKTFYNTSLDDLELKYSMFFEYENIHKLLIHLSDERGDYILNMNKQEYSFSLIKMPYLIRFEIFVEDGIKHILSGYDHLLFILMLIIPSIIIWNLKNLVELRLFSISIFKIITAFSIAHSMSLFLATTGIWMPSINFVESAIAFSIFVVALLNYFEEYKHLNYRVVFMFGLLHGFGFANVLEIGGIEERSSFLVALFGFNIGVEIGQVFAIIVSLPLLYLISMSVFKREIVKFLSFIALAISLFWFIQRV